MRTAKNRLRLYGGVPHNKHAGKGNVPGRHFGAVDKVYHQGEGAAAYILKGLFNAGDGAGKRHLAAEVVETRQRYIFGNPDSQGITGAQYRHSGKIVGTEYAVGTLFTDKTGKTFMIVTVKFYILRASPAKFP
jgi:hypothetical protein